MVTTRRLDKETRGTTCEFARNDGRLCDSYAVCLTLKQKAHQRQKSKSTGTEQEPSQLPLEKMRGSLRSTGSRDGMRIYCCDSERHLRRGDQNHPLNKISSHDARNLMMIFLV